MIQTGLWCLVVLSLITISCDKEEDNTYPARDMALVGLWKITASTAIYQGDTISYSERQLDSLDVVWIFKIKDNGTIEQTTNMSGPLVTFPGTWKTAADQLTMTLTGPDGDLGTLTYEYAIDGNLLMLQWALPNGGTKYCAGFTKQI
ncbi:MAG: lipocalin family protein [Bacteroidales bacterium]|nr:lipocalin family protein [Bacteroidales bacterium]